MRDAGSGLGSAGLIVLTDDVDLLAAAAGVARFLAVESCGQCTPCKQDGLALADRLTEMCAGNAEPDDAATIADLLATVADGARCALAGQQQSAVGSLVALAEQRPRPPAGDGDAEPRGPLLVAELVDIVDGQAVYDEEFTSKQPDWTYDEIDSGQSPVDRLTDKRADYAVQSGRPPIIGRCADANVITATKVQWRGRRGRATPAAAAAAVIVPSRTAASISRVRRRTAGTARKRPSR